MSRDLTNEADILRSVVRILEAMSMNCYERFICGIPTSIFEWALLWDPVDQLEERASTYDGHKFPSWSWIGWKGSIKYHNQFGPYDVTPLITDWQLFTPTATPGKLSPYKPDPTPENAWWPTTVWAPLPVVPTPEAAHDIDMHQATTASLIPLLESDVFQHSHVYRDFTHGVWRVFYPKTQAWVGTLNLGPVNPGVQTGTVSGACNSRGEMILSFPEEFIAIGLTTRPPEVVPDVNDGRDTFDTSLFRKLDVEGHAKTLVYVMWIRWGADGQARRMGIGQVHVDAWESLRLQVKRIFLS
ncbi:hypothetical protein DL95DRAFT_418144 [Leptodontidium sp. 2 PMI_412]|nr:hypothetical protein DL95DRAFT_418144 [Leptodontidium sp. 2 PMI_412]